MGDELLTTKEFAEMFGPGESVYAAYKMGFSHGSMCARADDLKKTQIKLDKVEKELHEVRKISTDKST